MSCLIKEQKTSPNIWVQEKGETSSQLYPESPHYCKRKGKMNTVYSEEKKDMKLSLYAINMTVYLKMQNNLQPCSIVSNLQISSID